MTTTEGNSNMPLDSNSLYVSGCHILISINSVTIKSQNNSKGKFYASSLRFKTNVDQTQLRSWIHQAEDFASYVETKMLSAVKLNLVKQKKDFLSLNTKKAVSTKYLPSSFKNLFRKNKKQ